ncbi:MAG: gliding motility-associated ABC transporter ATP-binding subunit GldA [Bacteroidota bacterium]|nr:gliding motility-associated ABC transporter ATP-binding subunit GldA [Bacteroidota bacterium]
MSIVVSNLTKNYGVQKAIDNISFQVNNNEIVGFLGPNGAGKSTTMKIVTGYLSADSGMASVNGVNVNTDPIKAKKLIGYLPESNPLYYEMYVREYLEFITGIHSITSGVKKRMEEVIDLTSLRPESKKKIGQLSKGYKQRVGLAAALIHDPEVLILDEPASGLDPNQIVEIREVIRELGKNKTVLFSSHILQEVESICDRVIIINKGNIVADDTLSSLRSAHKTSHTIMVEFAERVDIGLLKNLEGVINAEEEKPSSFKLQALDPEMVKKNLFSFSLENHLNIVSLRSEHKSLEDVFRNLTN